MTLDDKITRAKELIKIKEDAETELSQLMSGSLTKRVLHCSVCNAEGHTARTCPSKPTE